MKKLIILLLFIPLISFGQNYKDEKPVLMEKIKSWGDQKTFEIYKDLVLNVQDKSINVSRAMFPDPNDWEKQILGYRWNSALTHQEWIANRINMIKK